MADRTKLIPSEPLSKKSILLHCLHPLLAGIKVAKHFHLPRHSTFGYIENAVKMQTIGRSAAFPCADIQPPLAAGKVIQRVEQLFRKFFFGHLVICIGKSYEEVEMLMVYLSPKACSAADHISVFSFKIMHLSYGRRRAFFVFHNGVLLRGYIIFSIGIGGRFFFRRLFYFDNFFMTRPTVPGTRIRFIRNADVMASVRINFDLAIRHRFPPLSDF